ncbi:hypothetical protein DL769_008922 [Monosporascus sp. CRB-8-3]|nr:hypothetical protein DL769_008922 [Monosporascus sp. CRB-8-3]
MLKDWRERTDDEKYKEVARVVREQSDKTPRTATGPRAGSGIATRIYPNQMWLDGMLDGGFFYAKWARLFDADNTTARDDIVLQFDNFEAHTRNQTNGSMVHGCDESKAAVWANPVTGTAPSASTARCNPALPRSRIQGTRAWSATSRRSRRRPGGGRAGRAAGGLS